MNPVVHFEIPYENADRATSFYERAFGWQTQRFGEEMGNYVTVTTTESDPQTGRPTSSRCHQRRALRQERANARCAPLSGDRCG